MIDNQDLIALFQNLSEGVVYCDKSGKIVACNSAALRILDLEESQILGKPSFNPDWEIVGKDGKVLDKNDLPYFRTSATNAPISGNIIGLRSPFNPNVIWLKISSFPIFDENNAIDKVCVVFEDISDKRAQRKKELENLQKFRAIFHSSFQFNCLLSIEGIIVEINESARTLIGESEKQVLGISFSEASWWHDAQNTTLLIKQAIYDAQHGQISRLTVGLHSKTRGHISIDLSLLPVLDENKETIFILAESRDITDLENLNNSLRQKNQLLTQILNQFPGEVFWKDKNSIYLGCNSSFAINAGFTSASEVAGKSEYDMPWAEDLAKFFIDNDTEIIKTGKPYLNQTEYRYTAEGKKHWYRLTKVALRDENNDIIGVLGTAIDINDLIHAQNKLSEQEKQYRLLFEHSLIGAYRFVPERKIVLANPALLQMFGYNTIDELNHDLFEDNIFRFASFTRNIAEFQTPGTEIKGLETRSNHVSGALLYIREYAQGIYGDDGQLLFIDGTIENITEQKVATERLIESTKQLRVIIDLVPHFIFAKNIRGEYLMANKAIAAAFGAEPEQVIGKTDAELLYNKSEGEFFHSLDKIVITDNIVISGVEETFTTYRGEVLHLVVSKTPMKFGPDKEPAALGVAVNITNLKKANEELRVLSKAIEYSPSVIVITDVDGYVQYVNPQFERNTGYSAEEAIGLHTRTLKSGIMSNEFYKEWWDTIKDEKTFRGEILNKKKNGDLFWESVVCFPILNENMKIVQFVAIKEDITESKKIQQQLLESNQKLISTFQSIDDYVFVLDSKGVFIDFYVPAKEHIIQIANDSVNGRHYSDVLPDILNTLIQSAVAAYLAQDTVQDFDVEIKANEQATWFNAKLSGRKNAMGEFDGVTIVLRDITTKKENEKLLKTSEEKYQSLIEASPEGIALIDTDGIVTFMNGIGMRILGVDNIFQIPKGIFFSSLSTDRLNSVNAFLQSTESENEVFDRELNITRADGSSFIAKIRATTLYDAENMPAGYTLFFADITEEKQKSEELRIYREQLEQLVQQRTDRLQESEEKFKSLAESSQDVILSYSDNLLLQYANPTAKKLLQLETDNASNISMLTSGESGKIFAKQLRIAAENTSPLRFEQYYEAGTWIDWQIVPQLSDKSLIQTILVFGRDITLRKKAEQEIMEALQNSRELNQMKSRFVSMVSHEFRTPLATITSSTDILELFLDKLDAEERQQYFDKITNATSFITRLLDDIVTINRSETGKIEPKFEHFDGAKFISSLVYDVKSSYDETPNITLISDKMSIPMHSDKKLIQQITSNLIGNAIKYTPPERNIEITINADREWFYLEVKDQGVGIPKNVQKDIFEPFFRANNIGAITGTGLGLTITRQAVTTLNGFIDFVSSEGMGTTFFVRLPLEIN